MLPRTKDYIAVNDQLFFAVISNTQEDDRVLTFLRYIKEKQLMHKLDTQEAQQYIETHFPEFIFHSRYADIDLHGVPLKKIDKVYRPEETISHLLALAEPDEKQKDAIKMVNMLIEKGISQTSLGITGSLMLGTQTSASDIDVIIYGRDDFHQTRQIVKDAINTGELAALTKSDWQEAWQRRSCELTLDEYMEYEEKKYNKCICGNTKVDFTLIPLTSESIPEEGNFRKTKRETIITNIIDDTFAFDFPARFYIDHTDINEIVVYTATYIGQAEKGNKVEVAGYIEEDVEGKQRLVVGTSREAPGEYIRVIN